MITVRRLTALGPAIGATGAGLGGPVISFAVPAGAKVAAISARLRTRVLSVPVQSGSVLVQAAVVESPTLVLGAPADVDGIEDAPALWAGARYVSTARGARFMPGVIAMPEQSLCVAVRVWNRDNLDDSRRPTVDVTVTFCGPTEDVGGVESGHELGDHRPGTGTLRTVQSADPGNQEEASLPVPAGVVWRPLHCDATLVTDATASTRVARLEVLSMTDGILLPVGPSASQGASLTYVYTWGVGLTSTTTSAAAVQSSFPEILLRGGGSIETATLNLAATDNWTVFTLLVEEWVTPGVAV